MKRMVVIKVISLLFLGLTLYSPLIHALPLGWSSTTLSGETVIVDDVGNQWLSPVATQGMSYNDAVVSSWVTDQGFQSVDSAQYVGLLSAYGLPAMTVDTNGNGYIDTDEYSSGYGLIAKSFVVNFGHTYQAISPNWGVTRTWGYLSPDLDPAMAGIGLVGLLVNNGTNFGGVESGQRPIDASLEHADFGTWLFNAVGSQVNSVSEPSTSTLIVLGCLSTIWLRRRRCVT